MQRTTPIYCETSLNMLGSFPAEPINTYTSLAPVLFGALALMYLVRQRESSRVAYILAILAILTGLGSVAENGGAKLVHGSGGIWLAAGGVKLCHL
jgi:hypothetical protein